MIPVKRLDFLIVILFMIFAGLSTYCYADPNCGFDSTCPGMKPLCYKVVFSGVRLCDPNVVCEGDECTDNCDGDLATGFNQTWFLSYDDYCNWSGGRNVPEIGGWWAVYLSIGATTTSIWDHKAIFFSGKGPLITGSCSSNFDDCCPGCTEPWTVCGYEGIATYEPHWNCNDCDMCSTWDINSTPDTTIHYANEDCCPTAATGDSFTVTIDCNCCEGSTLYVVPEVGPYDANLVLVTYDPNCREAESAKFNLTALSGSGDPNTFTEVTCTASFFCSTGGTDSGSTTVTVRPHCGECCEPGKEGDPADCPPVAGSI